MLESVESYEKNEKQEVVENSTKTFNNQHWQRFCYVVQFHYLHLWKCVKSTYREAILRHIFFTRARKSPFTVTDDWKKNMQVTGECITVNVFLKCGVLPGKSV